jgi:hypothetical protein
MRSTRTKCTANHDELTTRELCRLGALFQAVRDIHRGFTDFQIRDFIGRRWRGATEQQIIDIIALAHRGIVAAGRLTKLPSDQTLPPGATPKLPR